MQISNKPHIMGKKSFKTTFLPFENRTALDPNNCPCIKPLSYLETSLTDRCERMSVAPCLYKGFIPATSKAGLRSCHRIISECMYVVGNSTNKHFNFESFLIQSHCNINTWMFVHIFVWQYWNTLGLIVVNLCIFNSVRYFICSFFCWCCRGSTMSWNRVPTA